MILLVKDKCYVILGKQFDNILLKVYQHVNLLQQFHF